MCVCLQERVREDEKPSCRLFSLSLFFFFEQRPLLRIFFSDLLPPPGPAHTPTYVHNSLYKFQKMSSSLYILSESELIPHSLYT